MNPNRIFESLVDSPEVCNYCFRKKAEIEPVPSDYPDFVAPRLFRTENSELVYPPDGRDEDVLIEINYEYRAPEDGFGGAFEGKWNTGSGSGSGRAEPISGVISTPNISCSGCGVIDDDRIDGEFPDAWEDRPKEKLLDVSRRVYHRLDEQGVNLGFDDFISRVEHYKTSDEYEFGDYEVLQDAVADAVSIKQQEI